MCFRTQHQLIFLPTLLYAQLDFFVGGLSDAEDEPRLGARRVSALALSHILRSFLLELATSGWIYHYNLVSFMEMAAVSCRAV